MADLSAELDAALKEEFAAAPAPAAAIAKPVDTGKTEPALPADTPVETTETESQVEVLDDTTPEIKEENTVKEVSDDDILKYVNEKTGSKYKTIDDFKSATSAVKEVQKLQKKIAEMEQIVPTDENSKGLLKFLKGGGTLSAYQKLQDLDSKKMSDRDKMVEYNVLNNNLSKEEAENLVDETYRLSEDEDETDRTVKAARTKLKIDAKKDADPFLTKWKQEAVVPQSELKAQQLAAKWDESIPTAIENISDATTFSFDNHKYKYNLTKEQKEGMAEAVKEAITNIPEDIDPNTPEGKNYIKEMAASLMWIKHGKSIVHATLESYKANELKRKSNSTVGLPAQTPNTGNVDFEDDLLSREKARLGRN